MNTYSIILPVKNGGQYVKECVNSILNQTCTDFNLIILDNCSTDGTFEWISSLTDSRVIIHPSAISLTIEDNWRRILYVPKNEFITCIGHDDILTPDYLAAINKQIKKHPHASLYQTHFNFIDAEGKQIRRCMNMEEMISPENFLEKILSLSIDVNGTGFMVRSADYDAFGGIPHYPNLLFADFALWIELVRKGYLAVSSTKGFSYRLHTSMTTTSTDEKFQSAFEVYVNYLVKVKNSSHAFRTVINKHAHTLIAFYGKSFSHRLLRTPLEKRRPLTVSAWVKKCRDFANLLIDNNTFHPTSVFSIKLAEIIDSTAMGRNAFLLFKKIYRKPVL